MPIVVQTHADAALASTSLVPNGRRRYPQEFETTHTPE
jgi:hypothetical protein